MSVQNLRDKFNQDNGTVPYKPPGLSYGKPATTSTLNNNNNNNINDDRNGYKTTSYYHQANKGPVGGRFKTIREESDAADDGSNKPVTMTKNSSFLQNYLANETARNGDRSPAPALPSKLGVAVRQSPAVTDIASRFDPKSPSDGAQVRLRSVKSPPPSMAVSKYVAAAKPASPTATVCQSPQSPTLKPVVSNGSVAAGGADKWKVKFNESETKRKTLLTQSQKREFPRTE